jgi:SAM-dependent methyltransferase
MTEQSERYDRISEGYARWWAPVIAPAALPAIDEVAGAIDAGATRVLDVGTGTGTLAVALLRRWPHIRVTAIDASSGMIDQAAGEADRLLTPDQRARLDLRVAFADDLGLDDGSIDVAVSSFVLQLVPNRFRALREVHRVLRPGGQFGWVSWLERDVPWAPDVDFDNALVDVGEEPREWSDRPGDLRDPATAVAQMRRAGFSDVQAVAGELVHPFTVDGFVGFVSEFDEEDLVQSLPTAVRRRFDAALRGRLERRRPEELALRLPTIAVRGTRRRRARRRAAAATAAAAAVSASVAAAASASVSASSASTTSSSRCPPAARRRRAASTAACWACARWRSPTPSPAAAGAGSSDRAGPRFISASTSGSSPPARRTSA